MNQEMTPVDVLLVEDNPTDIMITKEAFHDAGMLTNLHVVEDGEKALRFLRRQEEFSAAPRPDLILIDLNLPRKDGREVLAEIKEDSMLRSIPVLVLTVSDRDEDIAAVYDMQANCYIKKPVNFEDFVRIVRSIGHFWFKVVTLPKG